MTQQPKGSVSDLPEALRLADALDYDPMPMGWYMDAAAELRRLHGNERALEDLLDSTLKVIEEKNSRITELEAALRQALEALCCHCTPRDGYRRNERHLTPKPRIELYEEAITAAKQALEGKA